MKSKKTGFTLIELLVVIAIIGILSGIVMASLTRARSKGADAKVKAQLASIRGAAELYHDQNNSYNGTFGDVSSDCLQVDTMFADTDSGMVQYTDVANNYPVGTLMKCSSVDDAFAVTASLSTSGEFWCVDSTGASRQTTGADIDAVHPNDTTQCP